jgi:mannosylglycoprotein endo-beta-mannosidase
MTAGNVKRAHAQRVTRLFPVFYSDNYVTVLPCEHKTIALNYDSAKIKSLAVVRVKKGDLKEQTITLNNVQLL